MTTRPSRRNNVVQPPASRVPQGTDSLRVAMGWLAGIEENGTLKVRLEGGSHSTSAARTTVVLDASHVVREVTQIMGASAQFN